MPKEPVEKDDVLTSSEVAGILGVAQRTVRAWVEEGIMAAYGVEAWMTPGGDLRFHRSQVTAMLERLKAETGSYASLRKELMKHALGIRPRRVAVANNKGGVGKTTVAVNLAAAIAELTGDRVLVLDCDPQGNATRHLGFGEPPRRPIRAILAETWELADIERPKPLSEIIVPATERVWLAPNNEDGLVVEHALTSTALEIATGRPPNPKALQQSLVDFLGTLPRRVAELHREVQFDWLIFDTSPMLGPLTIQALTAADAYLVPVEAEEFSAHGVAVFEDLVHDAMQRTGREIQCLGYVINNLKRPAAVRQQYNQHIRSQKGELVFTTEIPESSALAEAAALGVSVIDYASRESTRGAKRAKEAFLALAQEVMARYEKLEAARSQRGEVKSVG